jgi:hypothetical protein
LARESSAPGRAAGVHAAAGRGTLIVAPSSSCHSPLSIAIATRKRTHRYLPQAGKETRQLDPITEGFIEIRDRGGGKVFTVIEFLSPANKGGGVGQEKYVEKQEEVLSSDASLVEIDLLRSGRRVLALPSAEIPSRFRNDYLVCISPGWVKGRRELYPLPLRQPLLAIPIPRRAGEARVNLALQPLVDRVYAVGRFDLTDYTMPPEPPLSSGDAAWAAELVKTTGSR